MREEGAARVALAGFGLAGSAFHAPLIAVTPGLRLAAIVTRDAERTAKARATYPGVEILPDVETVLTRAGDFELLVVATPNRTHVPFARGALRAGLHVVVDKPFAATAGEGRALIEEARRSGRLLSVFQNRRWDGDFLTVRDLLERGALGTPYRFESRFERWRPAPAGWKNEGTPEDATGLVYDLGSHLIDQALQLFGPVASVYAEEDERRPGTAIVDDAYVALTHASGVRSHLQVSSIVAEPAARFRVLGAEATFTKFGLDVQEAALRAGARPVDAGYGEEPRERWGRLARGSESSVVETKRGAYQRFYEGMAAALRGGAPVPVDAHDAVAGLEIIEAANRSARERRMTTPGEVGR
ncbi:MAG: Gfo/Idh/MocA family oxidoreductase [Gemmatimonadaceae bacterium]|nr:Gfo/Idh/MocA family oxidoreductase [Gemmatimonadaceae bacterium]NUQ94576.1 Gfo/Idh/MocA family oxidoreductase [Gemmatimonadaceae bacterium]NUR20232.1 Gfo/Idh/MocA family oxidoreductase [Gemmatimonadaceae bacterium]